MNRFLKSFLIFAVLSAPVFAFVSTGKTKMNPEEIVKLTCFGNHDTMLFEGLLKNFQTWTFSNNPQRILFSGTMIGAAKKVEVLCQNHMLKYE